MVGLPTIRSVHARGALALGVCLVLWALPAEGHADRRRPLGFEPRVADGIELEGVLGLGLHSENYDPMLAPSFRATYRAPIPVSLELSGHPLQVIFANRTHLVLLGSALALLDGDFLALGPGLGLMAWTGTPVGGGSSTMVSSFLFGHFRLGSRDGLHTWLRLGSTLASPAVRDSDGYAVGGFGSAFLFAGGLQLPLARVLALRLSMFGILLTPLVFSFDTEVRVRIGERAATDLQLIFGYRLTASHALRASPGHALLFGVEYRLSTAPPPPTPCSEWVTACP